MFLDELYQPEEDESPMEIPDNYTARTLIIDSKVYEKAHKNLLSRKEFAELKPEEIITNFKRTFDYNIRNKRTGESFYGKFDQEGNISTFVAVENRQNTKLDKSDKSDKSDNLDNSDNLDKVENTVDIMRKAEIAPKLLPDENDIENQLLDYEKLLKNMPDMFIELYLEECEKIDKTITNKFYARIVKMFFVQKIIQMTFI